MAKNDETYAHLSQLNTKQLEELLCADLVSPYEGDIAVIFDILELLEERACDRPAGSFPDEDQAWEELQN